MGPLASVRPLASVGLNDFGGRPLLRGDADELSLSFGGRPRGLFPGVLVGVFTTDFVALLLGRLGEDRLELVTLESLFASLALLGVFGLEALRVDIFEFEDFSQEGQNHFGEEGIASKPRQKV